MSKRLSDFSVTTKVVAAFACVLVATVALGISSYVRLEGVNAALSEIRDDWVPGVESLGQMKFVSMRYRQRQAVYLMLTTPEAAAKERANLDVIAGQFDPSFKLYSETADTPWERTNSDAIGTRWKAYLALEPELFAILRTKGQTAANDYYMTTLKHSYDALQDAVEAGTA